MVFITDLRYITVLKNALNFSLYTIKSLESKYFFGGVQCIGVRSSFFTKELQIQEGGCTRHKKGMAQMREYHISQLKLWTKKEDRDYLG